MQTQISNKDIRNVAHCEQKITKHLKFAQMPYQARLWTLWLWHGLRAWNGFEYYNRIYDLLVTVSGHFWLQFRCFSFMLTRSLISQTRNASIWWPQNATLPVAPSEIERPCWLIRISKPMFPQHMLEGNLYKTIKENQQARWEPKGMKQSVLWMKEVSQGLFSPEVKQTPSI